jgi:hypothetical protein
MINLELSRYGRRLKQTAEDYIAEAYGEAMAKGLPFDHETVAADALNYSLELYNIEARQAQAIEAGSKKS